MIVISSRSLCAFFDQVAPRRFPHLSQKSRGTYRSWLRVFDAFLARQATLVDLNNANYEAFGNWLRSQTTYTRGVQCRARRLLRTVWQEAHATSLTLDEAPAKRPSRRPRKAVVSPAPKRRTAVRLDAILVAQPELRECNISPSMLLSDFVPTYIEDKNAERPIGHELSAATQKHYRECVDALSKYLRRPAAIVDFTADNLNGLLTRMIATGNSEYSAANRRRGLLALWRQAHRRDLIGPVSMKVRKVHCPPIDVAGYTIEQARLLVETALELPGMQRFTGIPRSIYWSSAIRLLWDLGLRAGDVGRIEVGHFDPIGRLWVCEHKTGKRRWRHLHPSTIEAVRRCIHADWARELIWPGLTGKSFSRGFRRIARAAGLPGSAKWLRRGSSSAVEAQQPGNGWRFLDHSGPQVFERHYRIDAICQPTPIMPPDLVGPAPIAMAGLIAGQPLGADAR